MGNIYRADLARKRRRQAKVRLLGLSVKLIDFPMSGPHLLGTGHGVSVGLGGDDAVRAVQGNRKPKQPARWPEGPECPACGSTEIQTRRKNRRPRFHRCRSCGGNPVDTTGTFPEASYVSFSRWIYLNREMDKKRSINDTAKDLHLTTNKRTLGMSPQDRGGDLRPMGGVARCLGAETDDVHVKGGQQNREVCEEEMIQWAK